MTQQGLKVLPQTAKIRTQNMHDIGPRGFRVTGSWN